MDVTARGLVERVYRAAAVMPKPEPSVFPLVAWRMAVAAVAERLGADAIAPFGFEITAHPRYLRSRLRYLFVYVAGRALRPRDAHDLVTTVFTALREVLPAVADSIELVDCDRRLTSTGTAGAWRSLVVRTVDADGPLLPEWARYVAAAARRENRARISAFADFRRDLMAQRYGCQLGTMHDALFSSVPGAPRLRGDTVDEIATHLQRLQHVGLAQRFDLALVDSHVAVRIEAALAEFYATLDRCLGDDRPDVAVPAEPVADFHGRVPLAFRAGPIAQAAVDLVLRRYDDYAAVALDAGGDSPAI